MIRKIIALLGVMFALGFVTASTASATDFNGSIYDGDWGGSNYGSHNHDLHVWWVSSSHDTTSPANDHFGGNVTTNEIDSTAADTDNYCPQIAFDWTGSETGHYDSRIIRNCDSNSTKVINYVEPLSGAGGPRNMQADNMQIAMYDGDTTTENPLCWNPPPNETCDSWNPYGATYASHLFLRHADGTNGGHSGGDPIYRDK